MRILACSIAVAVVVAACGSSTPAASPTSSVSSDPAGGPVIPDSDDSGCDPVIDAALGQWEAAGFSGAVAFSTGGVFDCVAGYGLADRASETANGIDTVFSIGSISKAFTAAAVLHLVDDGELTLDDNVGDWLDGLSGSVAGVTIGQLLIHTSGIQGSIGRDHQPLGGDAAIEAIDQLELAFEPGTDNVYSNTGYTLLALIIDEAADTSFRQYLIDNVLTLPDGTRAGGFWDGIPAAPQPRAVGYFDDNTSSAIGDFDGPHWALDGNGGLAMTPAQLVAWTQAVMNGEIISPSSVQIMTTAGYDYGDGTGEAPGWVVIDETILGTPALAASGGGGAIGHDMTLVWLPEVEKAYVIASNGPVVRAESLLQSILPGLISGEPLPAPQLRTEVDPALLEAATGSYELESGDRFEVTAADDRLEIAAIGPDAIAALFPPPELVAAEDVTGHEALVNAFLAGETAEGREEVQRFEADLGEIVDVRIDGTIFADFELRTYVTLTTSSEEVPVWFALDKLGGLAAAEIFPAPPSLSVGISDEGDFEPFDLDGTDPDIAISFEPEATMTISGPVGPTEARRLP